MNLATPNPETWAKVFARILLHRITNETWQACFASRPAEFDHNRCFDIGFVSRCVADNDLAYDLFITDFARLRPDWQINLTGKTYHQWNEYDREQRKK